MLTLEDAINSLSQSIGANLDPAQEINLVCGKLLNVCDPSGSLKRVKFVVTSDSDGQGFITLPLRYQAIRGAVENPTSTSPCGIPIPIRNQWYEYAPGNLGMIKGSDPMRGIEPLVKEEGDTLVKYKVPACPSPGTNTYFTCICKLSFQFLENDSDVLPIQNLDALEIGLLARARRRASDYVRENELWEQAKSALAEQKDNETGPEAYG